VTSPGVRRDRRRPLGRRTRSPALRPGRRSCTAPELDHDVSEPYDNDSHEQPRCRGHVSLMARAGTANRARRRLATRARPGGRLDGERAVSRPDPHRPTALSPAAAADTGTRTVCSRWRKERRPLHMTSKNFLGTGSGASSDAVCARERVRRCGTGENGHFHERVRRSRSTHGEHRSRPSGSC
jgi:hypothetical protein